MPTVGGTSISPYIAMPTQAVARLKAGLPNITQLTTRPERPPEYIANAECRTVERREQSLAGCQDHCALRIRCRGAVLIAQRDHAERCLARDNDQHCANDRTHGRESHE